MAAFRHTLRLETAAGGGSALFRLCIRRRPLFSSYSSLSRRSPAISSFLGDKLSQCSMQTSDLITTQSFYSHARYQQPYFSLSHFLSTSSHSRSADEEEFETGTSSTKKKRTDHEKPRDLDNAYYPGPTIPSPSKQVVIRAMTGNSAICVVKFLAYFKTGSSAMLSEAIHSFVDTGNQFLLLLGLEQAAVAPDKKHQYGYGRAAYFWSLISALGMFWLGSGVTITHGLNSFVHPPEALNVSWETWAVLSASFCIDGWVLKRAYKELKSSQKPGVSFLQHIRTVKDPFTLAVFLEDTSACLGVLIASAGIGMTQFTGNPVWDSIASVSIGGLLGCVAVALIRMNQRFLLGQSVDPEIELAVKKLLLARPSIDNVYAVQSQWVGPSTFSYKAEVDFDGTYLAAKLLHAYRPVFQDSKCLERDLPLILAWYAEDITRLVEKEVQEVEEDIRRKYPQAAFIELEPDSKDSDLQAIAKFKTQSERNIERDAMNRALMELSRTLERSTASMSKTEKPLKSDAVESSAIESGAVCPDAQGHKRI